MGLIERFKIPENLWDGILPTGSSVICDPPVKDTDYDFVIYSENENDLLSFLLETGFTTSTEDDEEYDLQDSGMVCLRKGKLNFIVIGDKPTYLRWTLATNLATKFNLLKKGDRIALFQAILYPIEDERTFGRIRCHETFLRG